METLVGQEVGRYRILEQIGRGGMAVVYKAFDLRLETNVAIKFIRIDAIQDEYTASLLQRFGREAQAQARLTHPNIVKVMDYGEYKGMPYLVMPYLVGGSLKEQLGAPVPVAEAVRLLLPVARALAYAHEKGFVHRDVKPANIFLTETGEVMLADFGVAKILEGEHSSPLTGTGVGIGTPEYMAPEQAMGGEVDGRADVYALGVVLYEMITGRRPFEADTPMAVVLKKLQDPLPRPRQFVPDLPDEAEQVLYKALATQLEKRFANMSLFTAALESLARPFATTKSVMATETPPNYIQEKALPSSEPSLASPNAMTVPAKQKPLGVNWQYIGWGIAGLVLLTCMFSLTVLGWNYIRMAALTKPTSTIGLSILSPIQTTAQLPVPSSTLVDVTGFSGGRTEVSTIPAPLLSSTLIPAPIETPWPERIDFAGSQMVMVPAGRFRMGNETGKDDEKPVHEVYLDAFYIDVYEVTNAQFALCVSSGECQIPDCSYYKDARFSNHPVVCVDWFQAKYYCAWRGARLPTEAEWEKAARGGLEGKLYPWGDEMTGGEANFCDVNCPKDWAVKEIDDGYAETSPVGSYPPNGYGLYDMGGNAWEWINDWYLAEYYSAYPVDAWPEHPSGPVQGDNRVLRGGSRYGRPGDLRVSSRSKDVPDYRYYNYGFRCVYTP